MPYWKNIIQEKKSRKRNGMYSVKKEKRSGIKTEMASSSMKPFEDRPIEHKEEASKRKYEVIGTDIEMEYEEMDTEDEEHEVEKVNQRTIRDIPSI